MAKQEPRDTLDVALLPLEDGRKLMVPLQVLVEVQQIEHLQLEDQGAALSELSWRGHELSVTSLDVLCGLPEPASERLASVGVFKAAANSAQPFRALAFCGIAGHSRIDALSLGPVDEPGCGNFLGATRMGEEDYLIPDLPNLLFAD